MVLLTQFFGSVTSGRIRAGRIGSNTHGLVRGQGSGSAGEEHIDAKETSLPLGLELGGLRCGADTLPFQLDFRERLAKRSHDVLPDERPEGVPNFDLAFLLRVGENLLPFGLTKSL